MFSDKKKTFIEIIMYKPIWETDKMNKKNTKIKNPNQYNSDLRSGLCIRQQTTLQISMC